MPIGLLTGRQGHLTVVTGGDGGKELQEAEASAFLPKMERENLLVLWQVTETNEKAWKRLLHWREGEKGRERPTRWYPAVLRAQWGLLIKFRWLHSGNNGLSFLPLVTSREGGVWVTVGSRGREGLGRTVGPMPAGWVGLERMRRPGGLLSGEEEEGGGHGGWGLCGARLWRGQLE